MNRKELCNLIEYIFNINRKLVSLKWDINTEINYNVEMKNIWRHAQLLSEESETLLNTMRDNKEYRK